jgi:hypothetical protein
MRKDPKGRKRPADVIGNTVRFMRIATGEITETLTEDAKNKAAVSLAARAEGRGPKHYQPARGSRLLRRPRGTAGIVRTERKM